MLGRTNAINYGDVSNLFVVVAVFTLRHRVLNHVGRTRVPVSLSRAHVPVVGSEIASRSLLAQFGLKLVGRGKYIIRHVVPSS